MRLLCFESVSVVRLFVVPEFMIFYVGAIAKAGKTYVTFDFFEEAVASTSTVFLLELDPGVVVNKLIEYIGHADANELIEVHGRLLIDPDAVTAVLTDPPVADFTASALTGDTTTEFTFTDASAGTPTSWLWDFGDSETAITQSPTHTYTVAGTYTVTLTATNVGGSDVVVKTDLITVTEA